MREPPKNRGLTDDTKGAGSLPGAFELYQAGYTNLYHLYGGVNQYYQAGEQGSAWRVRLRGWGARAMTGD